MPVWRLRAASPRPTEVPVRICVVNPRTTPAHPTRRRLLQATGACLAAPWVARAGDAGVAPAELLIGQNITLQAGRNVYGNEVQSGVQVLLDHVNRQGGVHGRKVTLRTLDDDNKAALAEQNARALVADGVFLLFGSIEGGPSTAVMKAAVDTGVPFFGPMAGSPGLRRPHQTLVFPVRAEHREEFRALIGYGRRTGLSRVALFHADSDTGREHLENVRLLAAEAGMAFGGGLPFKPDVTDAQIDEHVRRIERTQVDLVINHGSPSVYERLIRRVRAAGLRTSMWAVNSGSSPLATALGPLARGMVFAQIVPKPWAGATALTREYQERFRRALPDSPFSYGSLEGYMTAKALVATLQAAGPAPTRAGWLRAMQNFELDLGGVKLSYRPGQHAGSTFVDLAMVDSYGRFVQ